MYQSQFAKASIAVALYKFRACFRSSKNADSHCKYPPARLCPSTSLARLSLLSKGRRHHLSCCSLLLQKDLLSICSLLDHHSRVGGFFLSIIFHILYQDRDASVCADRRHAGVPSHHCYFNNSNRFYYSAPRLTRLQRGDCPHCP